MNPSGYALSYHSATTVLLLTSLVTYLLVTGHFGGNQPGNHVFGNRRFAGNLYGNLPIGNRFFRLPELVTIVGYPCWYPSHPCRFGGYQRGYLEFGYYLTVLTLLITSTPQELS